MTNDRASYPGWPSRRRYTAQLLSSQNLEFTYKIPTWERCPGAALLGSPSSHLLGWKKGEEKCPEPPDLRAGTLGPCAARAPCPLPATPVPHIHRLCPTAAPTVGTQQGGFKAPRVIGAPGQVFVLNPLDKKNKIMAVLALGVG